MSVKQGFVRVQYESYAQVGNVEKAKSNFLNALRSSVIISISMDSIPNPIARIDSLGHSK